MPYILAQELGFARVYIIVHSSSHRLPGLGIKLWLIWMMNNDELLAEVPEDTNCSLILKNKKIPTYLRSTHGFPKKIQPNWPSRLPSYG